MTEEELTPEAIAILKSLVGNPHPIEDSATLQLLVADRLVMGSPTKWHITSQGGRLVASVMANDPA